VIIPAFNMADLITLTLRSVQAQQFVDYEVIVVDDCSTDGTGSVVQGFADSDSRIRYVRLDSNSNLPAVPRNRGVELARGEYVAFLDHDDLWLPWKLKQQVAALDTHPDLALVHSHLWVFSSTSRLIGLRTILPPRRKRADLEILLRQNVIQCSSVMARTHVVRSLGGFDERPELRAVEDYHLWSRIAREHRIGYLSEVQGRYRHSSTGTGSQQSWLPKHQYLDDHEGFDCARQHEGPTLSRLTLYRGLLIGLYFHLVEARIRRLFGAPARIW
jgi:glycosyltransferase involved in cell wall biosynthesis